ncbi:helix-turn-helix domain-containing protein [Eubacteriales bacterium OttesenSCG-928-K08]|nr:helix-turn-helix domain-containing protein [Eubacteriales bacterium OttesenSCG-928-K08]
MNRLKELRIQCGYTQEMLGNFLGIQKAAVCKYETGRTNIPQEHLLRIADLFCVSVDYILGRSDSYSSTPHEQYSTVPLLGRVHAGLPIFAQENIEDYIPVSNSQIRSGEYFFMEVVGDCMTDAHIVEGALVLVHAQSDVNNGDIVVVRVEDEVVLRKVKWLKNQLILYPANPAYEPMIISSGDAQIIGRIIEVRIPFP